MQSHSHGYVLAATRPESGLAGLNNLADLKPDNVMVKIEDQSILERDARDEYEHPLPQKHVGGRIVYLSRNNYGQPTQPIGVIQITDFDLAVPGEVPHSGCIQAEVYRAPEVILDAGYSYSADIWSLGVMVRDHSAFSDTAETNTGSWVRSFGIWWRAGKLFKPAASSESESEYDDQTHLAQITALLGPPPLDLLAAGRRTAIFYTPESSYSLQRGCDR